ncbi:RHS repeat-associated core domain-containing protein [Chryseobacterium lactis]|nr:RHS repeat-associated core domain-containing protein [Chryseobacterium lactis]
MKFISSIIVSCLSIFGFSQTVSPDKFHDTKGNIEVTSAGQLQYTLAIDVPPGIQKTAPNISLAYVSGATNGMAGYGWNISGISSISRIGKNLEKDGITKGVQLDYSDSYSFNGQRLILKSGEYGKDGAEYITEKYSNIKIKSVGSVTGQLWQGPEYWEITSPDGSQIWYGATASGESPARTPIDYNIVKSKDTNGNYVTYNYASESNVSVISTIEWGGNETQSTPHFNKIEFVFALRPMPETAYIKGVLFSQSKLLESVVVSTNSKQYKKYNVSYKKDPQQTAYRYLDKITVLNSKNEEANPVLFTYEKSYGPNSSGSYFEFPQTYGGILKFNSDTDVLGDFDGDGTLDLLRYHSQTSAKTPQIGVYLYKNYYSYNPDSFSYPIFTGSSLSGFKNAVAVNLKKNNVIRNRQGFVIMKQVNNTSKPDLELSFYSLSENNELNLDFKKIIPNADYDNSDDGGQNGTTTTLLGIKNVDFNGDGLSEIVLQLNDRVCRLTDPNSSAKLPHKCVDYGRYYVIDPDESIQNNNWYYPLSLYTAGKEDAFTTYKAGDFNGDGMFDFMKLDQNKKPLLITFKKNLQGKYESGISPFNPTNNEEVKGVWEDALVGDYNGDGVSDIMMPTSSTSAYWYTYTSKGNAFKEDMNPFMRPQRERQVLRDPYQAIKIYNPRTFVAYDINNDGKTDLISLESTRFLFRRTNLDNSSGAGYKGDTNYIFNVFSTTGGQNSQLTINKGGYNYNLNNDNINETIAVNTEDMIGVPVDLWTGAMLKRLVMASIGTKTHPYGLIQAALSTKYFDIAMQGRISSISQGGITTDITYKQLDKDKNPGLYDGVKTENYPYVEINQSTGMYVVSGITQSTTSDKKLKQDFRYRGLTSNIFGRGMIGFRKTARSSWYTDGFENTKIWTGVEIDPLNDGIPVKEWSIRTNDEAKIFPADVSENNSDLLSFTSTGYQIDKLLNGQIVTSVADVDKAKVVTAILPKITKSKDFLTGTLTDKITSYTNYYLPAKIISSINNNYAVTTSTFGYNHNPSGTGKGYYIGRPSFQTEVVQAYGDTQKNTTLYSYENDLLANSILIAGSDLDSTIKEEYSYDGFGNMTAKKTTARIDNNSRSEKTEYDPKGRFVIKKTDNLGLETSIEYNDWGQIVSQTDPFNNILSNTYDGWGKLLTSTTNLSGTTTYSYDRDSNSNVTVARYEPDGNISKTFTNKLGQEYKSSTKAFGQGQFISKQTLYDVLGRKIKDSEPYFEGQSASGWNTITYDDSVLPAKVTVTAFNGNKAETSVSGLTTTTQELNGYGRITSKTADALGNIISSTDKGGTIQFSYNAAGKQIQAKYAENIVTTKYDSWGRKIEFNDPSNGTYKYEYNGFGQAKKTKSPKGTKEYTYNNLGQLISQKELSTTDGGQATNKTISFTYNDKGLLTARSGQIKWQTISTVFTYDPQGRLLSSTENSNGKTYSQKGITYDDKGKVISYEKELLSYGVSTKVTIENVYSPWNGELYQMKDKSSGKILWELKEINPKGQVLKARLGAADVSNSYDTNGFLTNVDHSSQAKPGILQLLYSFDAIRNELKNRTTGGDFNIVESFDYDDNNRLINWTNPVTGIKPSANRNVYDIKGRIMENDQVGAIKYENAAKLYQPTGMTLNTAGTQNYNNDLIQTITYNENNDPVQINGQKAQISFEYGLGSMRQRVDITKPMGGSSEYKMAGSGIVDPNAPIWNNTISKFYSEDGSFEVVKDQTAGQEKHILYIGGSPYESNIVYLKDFGQTGGSYKFLHKDYIGSILAISDEEGNKVEQRHFDAWGNLTNLAFGNNGAVITDKYSIDSSPLLIDRGYTSHERFADIGIIHMNGRLYDPLLRRFLSADENIQDPSNTQNYNKYGYVMNNPLMYNDPSGEFIPWLIGAIVGGYLNGVAANNGNWNPGKWDWQNTWSAVLGGAIGGAAVSGALGNIASNAGAIKSFLPGIVSGGLNSAFNGGNFLGGAIGGISYTGNLFGNKMTSTELNNTSYRYMISSDSKNREFGFNNSRSGLKDPLSIVLSISGLNPSSSANMYSLSVIASLFASKDAWIAVGNTNTMNEWAKGYIKFNMDPNGLFVDPSEPNVKIEGITNPVTGKIILAPGIFNGKKSNYGLADVIIHENDHYYNWKNNILQGNHPLIQNLNEISAYKAASQWTGSMGGAEDYLKSVSNYMLYILNLFNSTK